MQKKLNSPAWRKSKNKKLFEAILKFESFSKPKDIETLKKSDFLNLCELDSLYAEFDKKPFKGLLSPEGSSDFYFKYEVDLCHENKNFGKIVFLSHSKFIGEKKLFLDKMSSFLSSSLSFIDKSMLLTQSKEQWDLVFDSFYWALCITDNKLRMLRTNQAFRELIQEKKSNIYGKDIFSALPIEVKPPEFLGKEHTWVTHGTKNSKPLSLEFFTKTIVLTEERLKFYIVIIKDISKESHLKKKISLQTQNREMGLIKASIAHELNNPIAGIKSLLQVMLGLKGSSSQDCLDEMLISIDRCETIVKDLLSASHK